MEDRPPVLGGAANILNKHSRTANKGWSFLLKVGRSANNSSPYKTGLVTTRIHVSQAWTDYLVHPKVMHNGHEIWYIELKDPVQVRVTYDSSPGISEV